MHAPSAAVDRIDGEDYTPVPREPVESADYVLQTLPATADGTTRTELHATDCWCRRTRERA